MLTNRKYSGRRPLVVVAALLSLMILLPLAGCKTEVDPVDPPTRCTVKFETAHGTAPSDITVDSGTKLTADQLKPLEDTASHIFEGWYDGETKAVGGEYTVTKDVTLVAKWKSHGKVEIKLTVSGNTVELASVPAGATIHYTTDETDPKTSETSQTGTSVSITQETTIKAYAEKVGELKESDVAEKTYYVVTFNANSGLETMDPQIFTDGVEQELSANQFKRDTWTFIGWSEDKIASAATWGDKAKFMATKDTTLYAVWTDNGTVAPVTFTPADGTTLYYGDTVTLATATEGATIQYHLGDGSWQDYTEETKIQVTGDTTITAKATKDGLKDSDEIKASYTVRQLTGITVTPPTKTVYSVGDTFGITSMKVTATYDDETTREVTESATTDFDSKSAGVKTVTVSYSEDGITKDGSFKVGVIGEATYQFTETVQDVDSTYTGTMSGGTYKKFGDWPQTVMGSDVMVGEKKITRGGLDFYVGTDGNYYVKQGDKYYKVEPVVWRVLTDSYNGKSLLLAENILTGGIKWADSSNNYQNSNIRRWLNGNSGTEATSDYNGTGFLQSAFTADAQALIATTTVDNSAASTNPASNDKQWNDGTNNYASDTPTTDKVFLLSEKEATTTEYGFATYDSSGTGSARIRVTTDYAKATGAYQSSAGGYGGWWWLRSPYYDSVNCALYVGNSGDAPIYNYYGVDKSTGGVVPALCVKLR